MIKKVILNISVINMYYVDNNECDIIINEHESLEGYGKYTFDEFEFESGCVLENVEIEYLLTGTPKYDENGKISNAIVHCHRFNSDYASINDFQDFIKKDGSMDKNEYFYISITSLGFPGSCAPSTTGLKHNFPKYSIKDTVNFKRKFLKEKLNLDKVLGVIGFGLGGYECYTWACEYPDEMEFIIVLSSSYKTNGYRYVVSKAIDSIMESSDDFYNELYSDSLSRIMVSINKILYSNYFSKRIFQEMSNDEIDVLMDDFVDEGLFIDIYDFKFRNDAVLEYNVEDKLKNIKAKAFIVSTNDDLYYSPIYDTLPLKDLIQDSEILIIESKRDKMDLEDYSEIEKDLKLFLEQFKK